MKENSEPKIGELEIQAAEIARKAIPNIERVEILPGQVRIYIIKETVSSSEKLANDTGKS